MKNLAAYFQFNKKEDKIFIPNEIFDDFKELGKSQVPFAFSYYYLNNWLYRYAKYGAGLEELLTQDKMKEILGYSPSNKRLNKLIKKNGLLEQMKWLETTNEIPITWEFAKNSLDVSDYLEFGYYEYDPEIAEYTTVFPNNYKIKKPIRAFTRYVHEEDEELQEEYADGYQDGTFYEIEKTTLIPFEVFVFCMEKEDLGCTAFYLWSYLKMYNQIFSGGYDIPLEKLAKDLRFSKQTTIDYLKLLQKYGMIEVIHNQEAFVVGLRKKDRKANTYVTCEPDCFSETGDEKVRKMPVMSRKVYLEKLKKEEEEKNKKKADIELDFLPY